MDAWHREIVELHDFFQAYFLGEIPVEDVDRLHAALTTDFTIIGADGSLSTREQTDAAIVQGHAHTKQLVISITDAQLLRDDNQTVVARYIENHAMASGSNHRLSTVVFVRDASAPNGLRWLSVHETWLAGTRD